MRQKFTTLTRLVTLLLLLIGSTWSMAQDRKTVNGTVLDKDQNPLPGVSYLVKGTNITTINELNSLNGGTYFVDIIDTEGVVLYGTRLTKQN